MITQNHGRLTLLFISLLAQFARDPKKLSGLCTANDEGTIGTHRGSTTMLADAAFANRHLLVQIGSDTDHVNVCGAANIPYGITNDCPAAQGDPINVHYLVAGSGTKRLTVSTALAEDVDVYTAANGQGQGIAAVLATAGTYYLVGRTKRAAQQAGDGNYYAEVEFCRPFRAVSAAGAATYSLV